MVKHEKYNTFPDALDALKGILGRRKLDLTEYHIVLTPDRYTLKVERELFTGGGAIDLEVLTLSRLGRRAIGSMKKLSREGGVMLVAQAVFAVKSELTYYKRAATFPDFGRQAYDALGQLASSDSDPIALAEKAFGVTKQKFNDLALIKAKYEELKAEYLDSKDRLCELIDRCGESELIKRTHFYAIGYSNETKLNLKVFDALSRVAKSFTLFDADEPIETPRSMEVYKTPDRITQYKALAARIREYVFKGGRYGDVFVVCPEPKTLARILREYGIDFYYDNSTPLDETPPTAALSLIQKIASGDSDSDKIITLCKNPFSRVAPADADILQYELNSSGTEYGALTREFKDFGARRAIERVKLLVSLFKKENSFSDACERVLDEADFDNVQDNIRSAVAELSGDDDIVFTDTVQPIKNLLDQVRRYGDGNAESDARSFFSAAHAVEVKSLPRYADRVTVASPETFRLQRCKKLFITDMNEGVLPVVTTDTGLISDAEINATGNVVEPTARESNRRARAELVAVINNAVDVTCFYHTSGARRAAFLSSVCGHPADGDSDYTSECAVLRKSSDSALIARFACVKNAARELAARGMTDYSDELMRAAGEGMTARPFTPSVDPIKLKSLSVSELTRWFECPYKRFLSHSVGLSRRASGFEAVDFGTVVHAFMKAFTDKYISDGVLDDSYDFALGVVENELEKLNITLDEKAKNRIVRDACDYATANKTVIQSGGYRPVCAEREFGGDITFGGAEVPFTGVIDRVDGCGGDLRVIDYKTFKKEFDYKKCVSGRDMQLPLYAAQLVESTGADVTGMFYMPLAPVFDESDIMLSGCIVKDADVIRDYDGTVCDGERSRIVGVGLNKNGTVSEKAKKSLYTREDLDELMELCVDTASLAADEISSGYIERAPADGACKYCAYNGLCDNKKNRSGV